MRVAVIDVGSNTARLLVAERRRRGPVAVGEAKEYLRLGEEIVRTGGVGPAKLEETEAAARRFASVARELDAGRLEVLVTAPGRQADNADELVATIERATGSPVRVLGAEEEGVLAFEGALARTSVERGPVAVCDVGGGSTELTVGGAGRIRSRSVDVGSLRLTAAMLSGDPPSAEAVEAAACWVREQLAPLAPPPAETALAVGGSARALTRLVGRVLDEDALGRALEQATAMPAAELALTTTVEESRAQTLAAGAVILREVVRLLDRPLLLAGGGIREGAVSRLLEQRRAA